jgi:hypothetical protein
MYGKMQCHLQEKLAEIRQAGLFKQERILAGPRGSIPDLENTNPRFPALRRERFSEAL